MQTTKGTDYLLFHYILTCKYRLPIIVGYIIMYMLLCTILEAIINISINNCIPINYLENIKYL